MSIKIMHEKLYYEYLATPIGVLTIKADDNYLLEVSYDIEDISPAIEVENGITNKCKFQLTEYFAGKRQVFDLPLKFNGTDFQEKIWHSLLQIPYGHTISYKQQSVMINKPLAMRAAGAANGRNKFTIIVPCHRVIGKNGNLTGYNSGIERKAWLLNHEKNN